MPMKLRDYQQAALEELRCAVRSGHRAQILYLPTAGGKTEVAIELMVAATRRRRRAAMVLDRIILCDQTSQRLAKYQVDHGVLQAGHWRYRPHEQIQICSAQTLEKRGSLPGVDLLIVDECHAQRRMMREFIGANPDVCTIGLTATPFTRGLSHTYSHVVCGATTQELVARGYLAPVRVFVAKEIEMSGAQTSRGEWTPAAAAARGMRITGDIVQEWIEKTHEVFGGPRKTIVFCANVTHGRDLARQFSEAGYNFVAISYRDTTEFNHAAIEEFRKPDSRIHGLIACDILTKGFDVPDVMIGISARPFKKSLSAHIQQLGRVMRGCGGKPFALWLDHSGNFVRFRTAWEEIYANGVDRLREDVERPLREPTPAEKQESFCLSCGHLWPLFGDTCPNCGHVRERRCDVIITPGEMHELRSAVPRETRQAWWSGLLTIAEERRREDPRRWALAKYQEKFNEWPTGLEDVPRPPTPECCRWVTSRDIAWAKRRRIA
jgi:superfamily II DNA or RNA helicase